MERDDKQEAHDESGTDTSTAATAPPPEVLPREVPSGPLGVQEAYVQSLVKQTPDWPRAGVTFLDISPLLSDVRAFRQCVNCLAKRYCDSNVTHVAGIDARGFTIGCALAYALNCGFIMIRKAGKLPPSKADDSSSLISDEYSMEYGSGQLQMCADLFDTSSVTTPRVLLVDDLLATGGTATAAANLLRCAGATVIEMAVLIEIVAEALDGRRNVKQNAYIDVYSLLSF